MREGQEPRQRPRNPSWLASSNGERDRRIAAELGRDNLRAQFGASEPVRVWAQSLIERERESPNAFLRVETRVTNAMHLGDNNAYFDFEVNLDYIGVLDLKVNGPVVWATIVERGGVRSDRPEPTFVPDLRGSRWT